VKQKPAVRAALSIVSSLCTLHQVRQDREVRYDDERLLYGLCDLRVKALDVWY
jgi:hypothetical protein